MTCNETIQRVTAESIVPKVLNNIKEGTPRSMRNAIELIQTFTDSELKQELLSFAKREFKRQGSNCCKLIQKTVESTDEDILKRVVVNLGVNSFSIGSDKLRAYDKRTDKMANWFETPEISMIENASANIRTNHLLSQYNETGCYAFLLGQIDTASQLAYSINLATAHLQSTFFIKLNCMLNQTEAARIKSACNIIVVVPQDSGFSPKEEADRLNLLREKRLLFGFCTEDPPKPQFLQMMSDSGYLFCVYDGGANGCFAHTGACEQSILTLNYERDVRYVNDLILHKRDFHGCSLLKSPAETYCR